MEKVTFGDDLPGYVCGDPTHPGVVVVQEWWGVTETIQAHALRISKEGYRVLVPDLYKGALGVNVEEAHHLMSNLDWDVATGTTRRDEHARDRGDRGVGPSPGARFANGRENATKSWTTCLALGAKLHHALAPRLLGDAR